MYRCNACGEIFDELGCKAVEEDRGEYWGIPCSETVYYECCPHCGEEDDFEEGKMFYAEGKTYYYDEDVNKNFQIADFSGEYFAEDDGESLYEEILFEERCKWGKKFPGHDIDVDIEAYWEV